MLAIVESGKIDNFETGCHELGENIYVNVMEYETKEIGLFESHHRTIDIHYPIDGTECIEGADEKDLKITEPYKEYGDYVLGNAHGKKYKVKPESVKLVVL